MTKEQTIKLIALDIDGTLITSDHQITDKTNAAIQAARGVGAEVVLSTGRPPEMCHDLAEQLELTSYLITASGGEIWQPDGTLLERHLHDTDRVKLMYEQGRALGLNFWLIHTEGVFENGASPTDFYAHEWLKVGFFTNDAGRLREMKDILATHEDIEITNSHPTNIEVNPRGVSKAHALQTVTEKLGFTLDNVLAMGDSLNDFTMIDQAGVGVAMGNAQAEIKAIADFVARSNDDDGVAQAIEKYVLNVANAESD